MSALLTAIKIYDQTEENILQPTILTSSKRKAVIRLFFLITTRNNSFSYRSQNSIYL